MPRDLRTLSAYFVQGPDQSDTREISSALRAQLKVFTGYWFGRDASLQINDRLRALLTIVAVLPSEPLGPEPSQKNIHDRLRTLVLASVLLRLAPEVLTIPRNVDPIPYTEARDAFFDTISTLDSTLVEETLEGLAVIEGCDELIRGVWEVYVPASLRKFVSLAYLG